MALGPEWWLKFPGLVALAYRNGGSIWTILSSRNHHKMIDDQYETYTSDLLRQIKVNHEKWVSEKLNEKTIKPIRIRRIKENIPQYLNRLTSGKEVLNIIDGTDVFSFDNDELETEKEVELIGNFIQIAKDWGDLGPDLEPSDRVRWAFELSSCIKELEEVGFFIFGAKEVQLLEGGVLPEPTKWYVAILSILRKTNQLITIIEVE